MLPLTEQVSCRVKVKREEAHLPRQEIYHNHTMFPRYIIRIDPNIATLLPPEHDLQRIDIVHLLRAAFLCGGGLAAEMMETGVDDRLRDVGRW